MKREFFQCLALVFVGLFVNVNVTKVPFSERFEHALMFGALDELGQGQTVKRGFAIMTFADEDDLRSVAGHAGRERFEPAGAGWTAGTGFFQVARDFPWSLRFGFVCCAYAGEGNNAAQGENKRDGLD